MKFLKYAIAGFAASFAFSGAASAATITGLMGSSVIAAPATVGEDTPTNTEIQAFNEGVDILLALDLAVDAGVIAAGTRVDSHMIFLNTLNDLLVTDTASYSFSETILGVMSDQDGDNLFDSDDILSGTIDYIGGNYGDNRGLEDNDSNDFYSIVGLNQFNIGMRVTEPGDWVRVITASSVSAVPVPAGLILLPTALFGLRTLRRRKARNAA